MRAEWNRTVLAVVDALGLRQDIERFIDWLIRTFPSLRSSDE